MRFATQPAPLGTVNAVLCASEYVSGSSYGVGNADDVYGVAACALLAAHLRAGTEENALVGYRLADAVVGFSPVTSGICTVGDGGLLLGVDERRQVQATPEGSFVAGDGREPAALSPESRVSMNLWGFTPAFHAVLQDAMDAAVDASEEAEVLLPEVVGRSLTTSRFTVLPAVGRCVGVTHPDDLALVQDEINRQVGTGERPAALWSSARLSRRCPGAPGPGRDATPSNRSAEASRAPRGHVCEGPLAPGRGRVGQPPPGPASAAPGKPP